MGKTLLFVLSVSSIFLFSGCAEDNYNSGYYGYNNNYSNSDRNMNRVANNAMYDATKNFTAQDYKNLNNLK